MIYAMRSCRVLSSPTYSFFILSSAGPGKLASRGMSPQGMQTLCYFTFFLQLLCNLNNEVVTSHMTRFAILKLAACPPDNYCFSFLVLHTLSREANLHCTTRSRSAEYQVFCRNRNRERSSRGTYCLCFVTCE